MVSPILIDGSQGEGGGQILRTSLALSMITGKAFTIERIRAGRQRPGLMRQHLTAVQAAARVCSAAVEGDAIGSQRLVFRPAAVTAGDYEIGIGSAGSTTLVLQTLLPPLMLAGGPSRLVLEGGTHNPFAPPLDFLEKAFAPLLRRMGVGLEVTLERHGFYPAGGGRFSAVITPTPQLRPLHLPERGEVRRRLGRAVVSLLPAGIAGRELNVIHTELGWSREELREVCVEDGVGPGNVLTLEVESEHVTEVFTGFGQKGVGAEKIARDTAAEAKAYLESGVPVGAHLADQLLIPLALAGEGSFVTGEPSEHTRTNARIIERFLDVRVKIEPTEAGRWGVSV